MEVEERPLEGWRPGNLKRGRNRRVRGRGRNEEVLQNDHLTMMILTVVGSDEGRMAVLEADDSFLSILSDHSPDPGFSALVVKLGIILQSGGRLERVLPGSPAHLAGIERGDEMVAVNGREFGEDVLMELLADAFQVSSDTNTMTVTIRRKGDPPGIVREVVLTLGGQPCSAHMQRCFELLANLKFLVRSMLS